ncbi:hypothetical protein NB697_002737 [Xanthomonas sacchari]|nr:hypothetical protein [Xanthomonas sacchari]MCW0391673.1 hypothetical protein [Xanthomonas sacchari]MCW0452646.1 hypothetical protein [Xanthomonas sacchari]
MPAVPAAGGAPVAPGWPGALPGELLVAPGAPCGPLVLVLLSLTCSLRSFGGSPLYSSRASSTTEKSMSTFTSGLTRPGPVIGSSSSRMRWL